MQLSGAAQILVLPEWVLNSVDPEGTLQENAPFPLRELRKYKNVPVLLKRNGELWREGTLFLISRLVDDGKSGKTIYSNATHLLDYARWCDETGTDWTEFKRSKHERPTYAYRQDLKDRRDRGEVKPSTASNRIGAVVALYRWLMKVELLTPEFPPFKEKIVGVQFKDAQGFSRTLNRISSDLALKRANRSSSMTIDGGLAPLEREEQDRILEAAEELASVETRLMMELALRSGFRIETVCNFKASALEKISGSGSRVPIRVGPSVGIKTKGSVDYVSQCERKVIDPLRVYAHSERRLRRTRLASGDDGDFLFLTKNGEPFLKAESSRPPTGIYNDVSRVRDSIRRITPSFNFKFHDLRASFGMNLLDDLYSFQNKHNAFDSELDLVNIVRESLGHAQLKTTWEYLNYRKRSSALRFINGEHEDWVMSLVQKA